MVLFSLPPADELRDRRLALQSIAGGGGCRWPWKAMGEEGVPGKPWEARFNDKKSLEESKLVEFWELMMQTPLELVDFPRWDDQ